METVKVAAKAIGKKKAKKGKTPQQIYEGEKKMYEEKINKIKPYFMRTFTSDDEEKPFSVLAIKINYDGIVFKISDCERNVYLRDYFEFKEGLISAKKRLLLFRDEFSKAYDHLEAEIERLKIEL
jgi:hypothetical protein